MAKLKWNENATKRYEAGCSDVAVFIGTPVKGLKGEAWDGITGVSVNPDGGDANDQYANNVKWLSLRGDENVKGAIKAFMYPPSLNRCTGYKRVHQALAAYVGQQVKEPLSIAYKTKVGNIDKGIDYSEKLHVIFNMTLGPVQHDNTTINKDPSANELSWDYSTTPENVGTVNGEKFKPTAIIEIERDEATADVYDAICDILYGTDPEEGQSTGGKESSLLMPADIIKMLLDEGLKVSA